jgi:hypothetical protein
VLEFTALFALPLVRAGCQPLAQRALSMNIRGLSRTDAANADELAGGKRAA